MTKNMIINILPEISDLSFGNVDFYECLQKNTMQYRVLRILGSKENNWLKPLYDDFVNGKARGETKGAYVARLTSQMDESKKEAVSKCGVLDFEILANVFDAVERERKHDFSVSAPSKEMECLSNKAEFACVIIDRVAKEISFDKKTREEYIKANSVGKKAIIMAKLKTVNTCLEDKNERVQGLNRWMPYYMLNADKIIENASISLLSDDKDNTILAQMSNSFSELVEKDKKWLEVSKGLDGDVVNYDGESEIAQSVTPNNEEKTEIKTKKFGDLYPREMSQKQISKILQPFNITAGIKFLNQLLDAFQQLEVSMN